MKKKKRNDILSRITMDYHGLPWITMDYFGDMITYRLFGEFFFSQKN